MVRIIQANSAHSRIICEIAEKTWRPAYREILSEEQIHYMLSSLYNEESIRQQLESGSQTYLLLLEDEKPVAFAAYSQRPEKPEVYKLHKLYCLPEGQGKGYGKNLIEALSKRVLEAGGKLLELNVNRHNKAKNFYEKLGFTVAYQEDIPIGKFWMNDYVMRKQLGET